MKKVMQIILIIELVFILNQSVKADDNFSLLAIIQGDSTNLPVAIFSGGGDLNGDGYNDLVIGSAGLLDDTCIIKIYCGGSVFDTVPDWTIRNGYHASLLNTLPGAIDDLNGDGFFDIMVGGSPNSNFDPQKPGEISVYYGGSNIKSIPDLILSGDSLRKIFILGIAAGGDINGDGWNDLIVTTENPDYLDSNIVYIYWGGPLFDDRYDDTITWVYNNYYLFGADIDLIGDVNHDGYDDILVAVPSDVEFISEDFAYLFWGGEKIDSKNPLIFSDNSAPSYYASDLSGIGDVNGDGFADFAIVGYKHIRVFLGNSLMDTSRYIQTESQSAYDCYEDVIKLGDLNQDGFSDFGAVLRNMNVEKVSIHFGAETVHSIPDYTFTDNFKSICSLGDINGDSKPEIAMVQNNLIPKIYIYTCNKTSPVGESNGMESDNRIKLYQNYPNPFTSTTELSYYIPTESRVDISIYNLNGQLIRQWKIGNHKKGEYSIRWDGKDDHQQSVTSGVYIYKITAVSSNDQISITRKMLYLQ